MSLTFTCEDCGLPVEYTFNEGWWRHESPNFFDAPCGIRLMDRYSVLPYPEEDE